MVGGSDFGSVCLKVLVEEECCGSLVVVVQRYSHCCYAYEESLVPDLENVVEISHRSRTVVAGNHPQGLQRRSVEVVVVREQIHCDGIVGSSMGEVVEMPYDVGMAPHC